MAQVQTPNGTSDSPVHFLGALLLRSVLVGLAAGIAAIAAYQVLRGAAGTAIQQHASQLGLMVGAILAGVVGTVLARRRGA